MGTSKEQLKSLLTLAYRAGKVHFGWDNVKFFTRNRRKGFVIFTSDLSERMKRELRFIAAKGYNVYKLNIDKKTFGSWFGKETVGMLFLPNTKLTFKIENLLSEEGEKLHPVRKSGGVSQHKEVEQLETQRVRRTIRNRLQKTPKNIKGKFRFKRQG